MQAHAAHGAVASLVVLAIFAAAMLIAFVAPRVGFGLICGALSLHLWSEPLAVARDGP